MALVREPSHVDTESIELPQVLHALSDETRLRIVARLAAEGGDWCATLSAEATHLHKSTISHHYRVLREAGVTRTEIRGRERWVELRRDDLDRRFPGLMAAILDGVGS